MIEDFTFSSPSGNRVEAYLVRPAAEGVYPGVLYVHWLEPHSPLNGREQFLSEAAALAKRVKRLAEQLGFAAEN